jgi:hypothetical protein
MTFGQLEGSQEHFFEDRAIINERFHRVDVVDRNTTPAR